MTGTGSHVFLGWETADQVGKTGSRAQGGQKPLRKRGLKVQSPIGASGVIL